MNSYKLKIWSLWGHWLFSWSLLIELFKFASSVTSFWLISINLAYSSGVIYVQFHVFKLYGIADTPIYETILFCIYLKPSFSIYNLTFYGKLVVYAKLIDLFAIFCC
jgi:hypothetical protein